ncbi:MAG: 2,3-bisphosphoglycerate-independent phosphoglycerate mutase [Candidatus Aenigmarchaeota archaeon]|nr:2,3-bisphosphoglycerate-independent phosphoglycerate mutase [Candidatus Aenigmarchaeota archaeon]
MQKKKIVFLVIDGLADLPINGKTPLSEARKPNLDYLAKNGILGEIIPVEKVLWSELRSASVSHVANIALLGYDPKKFEFKRGPLEAVGADLPYREGHLAVRCNFVTVDKDLVVVDRHAGRNSFGLDEIARSINEHVKIDAPFVLIRTYEHRAVLVIKERLSDKITDSDPLNAGEKVKRIEALAPEAERSAKLLQDFIDKSRQLIEFHPVNAQRIKNGIPPANCILTREAGNRLFALPNFPRKHKVRAVCIAENGVMKATCMLAGFNSITVPELRFKSSLKFIFDNIKDSLTEFDFVYAHIKGPDEPAHDGEFHKKREMIEEIDEKLEYFKNFNGILVVTCDHITACKTRKHEYGAVPVLIYGLDKGKANKFDEFEAKKGKLGLITGKKLWQYVFSK